MDKEIIKLRLELLFLRFSMITLMIKDKYLDLKILKIRLKEFFESLQIFINLYKAGFRIMNATLEDHPNFEVNRFYWKNEIMREVPDIFFIDGKYIMSLNGKTFELK